MMIPRIPPAQRNRKALRNIGKNLLFLLRNRRRRRLILSRLPFCMNRILYRMDALLLEGGIYPPRPRDVPGPRQKRLRLSELRRQRPAALRRSSDRRNRFWRGPGRSEERRVGKECRSR